jgi:superfamily II DNA or RNA helicase
MKKSNITQGGYCIPLNNIKNNKLNDIKKKLIAIPNTGDYGGADNSEYNVYIQTEKNIFIPRYFGIKECGDVPIDNSSIKASKFKFTGSLRDYQINITSKCITHLKEKYGGILSVPCGRGKTTMALYLASLLGLKTLVLVHKGFLLDQWVTRIQEFTDAKIGIIRQNKTDVIDKDIVVGMIQSISMKDYDPAIFKDFGCVIVDETHHIVSKTFSRALFKLGTMYTIGLSATPKRADGLSYLLNWFLGDIMYQEGSRINTKVAVKIFNYKSDNELFFEKTRRIFKNGKMDKVPDYVSMISNLCELEERTNHLFNMLNEIIRQNPERKILVLSARKQHLSLFKDCADAFIASNTYEDGEYKPKTAYYIGETKQKDRQEAEEIADILFATYDMAQEALDIKRLNTLILTTPKKDVEQSIGRIMRKEKIVDGDIRPLIIDFRDILSIFDTHGKKRESFYKKNQYKIKHYFIKNNKLISENKFNNDNDTKEKYSQQIKDIILDIDDPDYKDDDIDDNDIICNDNENNEINDNNIDDVESDSDNGIGTIELKPKKNNFVKKSFNTVNTVNTIKPNKTIKTVKPNKPIKTVKPNKPIKTVNTVKPNKQKNKKYDGLDFIDE